MCSYTLRKSPFSVPNLIHQSPTWSNVPVLSLYGHFNARVPLSKDLYVSVSIRIWQETFLVANDDLFVQKADFIIILSIFKRNGWVVSDWTWWLMYPHKLQLRLELYTYNVHTFLALLVFTQQMYCRGARIRRPSVRCPLTQVSRKPLHGSRLIFLESYLSTISPALFSCVRLLLAELLSWHRRPSSVRRPSVNSGFPETPAWVQAKFCGKPCPPYLQSLTVFVLFSKFLIFKFLIYYNTRAYEIDILPSSVASPSVS